MSALAALYEGEKQHTLVCFVPPAQETVNAATASNEDEWMTVHAHLHVPRFLCDPTTLSLCPNSA